MIKRIKKEDLIPKNNLLAFQNQKKEKRASEVIKANAELTIAEEHQRNTVMN